MIICVCALAKKNCYMTCSKGRRLDPAAVYCNPKWEYKPLKRGDDDAQKNK